MCLSSLFVILKMVAYVLKNCIIKLLSINIKKENKQITLSSYFLYSFIYLSIIDSALIA